MQGVNLRGVELRNTARDGMQRNPRETGKRRRAEGGIGRECDQGMAISCYSTLAGLKPHPVSSQGRVCCPISFFF